MKFLSNRKNSYFTGMYLSLFAFMICSAAGEGEGVILFKISAVLLFGLFLFGGNNVNGKADFEKSVMVLAVGLFNILMLQRGKMQGYSEIFNIICSVLLIIMGITYFIFYHEGISVKKWFSENKLILLVITCFVLLSIEVINHWVIWDTWQYFTSLMNVRNNFNADLSGIYNLYLCGHVSLGYSLWLILFQLFQEGAASVQVANIILAGISIYAYYQIVRKLLGNKYSNNILVLATMPYAFSPFVMGMIGNASLDMAAMYFAVIFIACSLHQYECLELLFAFLFCFTKEPNILCYVAYVIVKVLCDYLAENHFHLWKLIKFGFGNVKNYVYALPAILWLILYKLKQDGTWAGGTGTPQGVPFNCFGISREVIMLKLKQIVFLNFNWLFWIAIILGIIILCAKKIKMDKETYKTIIPLSAFGMAAIIFGCVYITYILPRYIVPIIPVIYLIATVLMGNVNKNFFISCKILLSVLLMTQCFRVVDPVMSKLYPSRQVGKEAQDLVYETGSVYRFDDHIAYNRQSIHWSETITKLFDDSGYDGHMLVVYSYSTTAPRYELIGNDRCLWNTQKGELEYYDPTKEVPKECVWVNSCRANSAEGNWEANDYSSILYIIPQWANVDENLISDNRRFSKEIIKQGEVDNKGFRIQYMVINMEYKASLDNGDYVVSPKQDSSLGIGADGQWLRLKTGGDKVNLAVEKTGYQFIFNDYHLAMDVRYNKVDENGTVWLYEDNDTNAQRWDLEKVEDYYMICWGDYALTYDLDNASVRLTPKTGSDNQLWSFN